MNTGIHHATEAARIIGGRVALPDMGRKADMWDVWAEQGAEAVRLRIREARSPEPEPSSTPAPDPTPTAPTTKLADGYSRTDKGIFCAVAKKDGVEPVWLGPPLDFVARTRDGQSGEWGLLLAWHDPDGVAHQWAMPYTMLTDARQVWSTLAAGGYIPSPNSQARAMLAALLGTVAPTTRARCVPGTGWHYGRFVLPDAVFGPGEERLVLQAPAAENPYAVAGTLDDWRQSIGTWARGNSRLTLAVSVALAGPLLSLVGMESGAIHLYGSSSTGKTASMRAGWSVWGPPSGWRSWRTTANALEGMAALHADTLLALDEIGEADPRTLDEAAYLLLNGRGKMRANVDGSARAVRRWTVMVISTGEMTLSDRLAETGQKPRAGQEVRLIDLPADAGQGMGAWEALHGHATPAEFSKAIEPTCAAQYGHMGRAWLDWLTAHQTEVRALAPAIRQTAEQWAAGATSGQVVRVAERFAVIGWAGELATQAGLMPWSEGAAMAAAKTCLEAWLNARGGSGDREDMQAVEIIRGYVARYGAARFQTIAGSAEDILPTPGPERPYERAGFRRTTMAGEEQFLFTRPQWDAIFVGRNPQQAAKALDRAGLLVRNDNSLAQKVSLPDMGRERCYVVRMTAPSTEDAP